MLMAGRTQKPNALGIWPGQDAQGAYAKRCIKFADEYGFTRGFVCSYWAQIAIAVEFEAGRDRVSAEDSAWRHIQAALHGIKVNGDCN